jgi:carboxyl-terminal processing protease
MFKRLPKLFSGIFIGAALVLSFAYTPDYFELSKQLDIFTSVFKEVSLYYVDDTQPGELAEDAINSMLSSLDPYTNYIPEEAVEDFRIQQTGDYAGVGASVGEHESRVIITSIYEGFAANKAELLVGDEIISIDSEPLNGRSIQSISEILKGAPGTEIQLGIRRAGEDILKTIEREKVHRSSVPFAGFLENDFGYISLSSFTQNASGEVKNAWEELSKEKEVKGLVLDLRNNPGGLLVEAINLTNLFIPKGKVVVQTKGKLEEWQKTYKTSNRPFNTEIPVVVLINSGSASASEIVAGTLQDYDRALILGRRSFGKGLVQESRMLPYGAQLKVTIAKYYTPSGRLIQAIDYAERAEDGSVSKVPDSLRNAFTTDNGRVVYDGGGIDPDVQTESPKASELILALFRDLQIFDFATEFYFGNPNIKPAKEFRVDDVIFNDFKSWLEKRDFSFDTRTGRVINNLEIIAAEEDFDAGMSKEINDLKQAYEKRKSIELDREKDILKELLQEEIVARYYFESGRLENALNHDTDIKEALRYLNETEAYQAILSSEK